MTAEKKYCCCEVWGDGQSFRPRCCARNAIVNRDGRWYCGTHDPVKVAEKNAKRESAWKVKMEEQNRSYQHQRAIIRFCENVTDDELSRFTARQLIDFYKEKVVV